MACRIVSIDGILEPSEIEFVKNVAIHLGFKSDFFKELESYLHVLVSSYNSAIWNNAAGSVYSLHSSLSISYSEVPRYSGKARKAGYHC